MAILKHISSKNANYGDAEKYLTFEHDEFHKYGQNRIAEGKVPLCAAMCSTKALLVGDKKVVDKIYNDRVELRGYNTGFLGTLDEYPGNSWK